MIYKLSKDLAARLASRGCPLPVIYGPEPKKSTVINRPRIVLQRTTDDNNPRRSQFKNPKQSGVRACGVVLHIFAQSNLAGAGRHDHERMAEQAADMCTVGIRQIVSSYKTLLAWGPAHFLTDSEADLAGIEQWHGVIYELRFTVDRGIEDRTWQGEAAAEAELGTDIVFDKSTEVTDGSGPVESSCGA